MVLISPDWVRLATSGQANENRADDCAWGANSKGSQQKGERQKGSQSLPSEGFGKRGACPTRNESYAVRRC